MSAMISLVLFVPGVIAIYWLPETNDNLIGRPGHGVSESLGSMNTNDDTVLVTDANQNGTLSSHVCTKFHAAISEFNKVF